MIDDDRGDSDGKHNQRSINMKQHPTMRTTTRLPSCCLLVFLCGALALCASTAKGFVSSETTHQNKRSRLGSSSSLGQPERQRPLFLSSAHHHHHHHIWGSRIVHYKGQQQQQFSSSSSPRLSMMMLRGGGSLVGFPPPPLGMEQTTTACYASVLFLTVTNLALLVAPNFMMETLYNVQKTSSSSSFSDENGSSDDDMDNHVASTTFLRLIGTAGLGVALSLYMAIVQKQTSLLAAMGWGLVPRTIHFWYLLLAENRLLHSKQSFASLQGKNNNKPFVVNTILTTWVAAALLLGLGGNPAMTAKVFSTMSIIKCSLLVLRPRTIGSKFVGFDVNRPGMSQARVLLRAMGIEFLVAAVLMASLAFGVNAVTAAGLVFAVWSLFDFVAAFAASDKPSWANNDNGPVPRLRMKAQMVNLVLNLIFAAGFLVPFKK